MKRSRNDDPQANTQTPEPTRRERDNGEPTTPRRSAVEIGSGTDWDQILIQPEGTLKPGDPDYDPDRPGNRKAPKPTERERELASFGIAIGMMKAFGYSFWMSNVNVCGPGGERINREGEIYNVKSERITTDEIDW